MLKLMPKLPSISTGTAKALEKDRFVLKEFVEAITHSIMIKELVTVVPFHGYDVPKKKLYVKFLKKQI